MQQYNYVIFQTSSDYYRISYSDLINRSDVVYIDQLPHYKSKIAKLLYRIHHSKKINRYLPLPGKSIWYRSYFKNTFPNNLPLCFIFNARWLQHPYIKKYILYLRKLHNNGKFVCFYQDLVVTHLRAEPDKVSDLFDLKLSYDKGDAEQYGLTYHPTVFSNFKVDCDENIPESDVYFIGIAKDRLELILDVFYRLKEAGLTCDFYLSRVPTSQQIEEDGLNYIDKMSYIDNLKHVVRTKNILEIVQQRAKGSTIRTWEAIMYNKKLLTNNLSIKNDPFYNDNYIRLLNPENIDVDFLKQSYSYTNPFKELISPHKLLKFITEQL